MSGEGLVNIAAALPEMARQQPYELAVACPAGRDGSGRPRYVHHTFKQLDEASSAVAHGLAGLGLRRGDRAVLMISPSLPFFEGVFALFKMGVVPVIVDPGMGVRKLGVCLREAAPRAFIGIPKAQLARRLLGWASDSLELIVTAGWSLTAPRLDALREAGAAKGDYPVADTRREDMAAILFTSGSTGVPKGAVYSHGNFAAQVECIRETYGIAPGERDCATFPLFGLFGPALGMTTIVPDMDATRPGSVDPERIREAIEDWGASNMFGSPALLRRVAGHAVEAGWRFPSLKRVISAGAPVPPEVLEKMRRILAEGAQVFTPYGATESLPVASIGSDEVLDETAAATARGEGTCVGRPVSEVEVRILRITDEPIASWSDELCAAPGEVGEIAVKGPRVTRAYFRREASTALAKIADGEDVWHRMGDLGRFDEAGRLWFFGRKSQRVRGPRGLLFTAACEGVFNAHPAVLRSALVGPERKGEVVPTICIELDRSAEAARRPEAELIPELLELGARHEATRDIRRLLIHPAFPVDIRHNSKIFRERLREWAQKVQP